MRVVVNRGVCCDDCCRKTFWFWDSVTLFQTFGIAAAQVFANPLGPYFQLIIMLVVLMISVTGLAHCCPFEEALAQSTQVCFRLCKVLQLCPWPAVAIKSINPACWGHLPPACFCMSLHRIA